VSARGCWWTILDLNQ